MFRGHRNFVQICFATLVVANLLNYLFLRQDFWGEAPIFFIQSYFKNPQLAVALFMSGIFLVIAAVYSTFRNSLWSAFFGLLLWVLYVCIHSSFGWFLNGGDSLLALLILIWSIFRLCARDEDQEVVWEMSSRSVGFLLGLIFIEAGFSKFQSPAWWSGASPQLIISAGFEIRDWVESVFQMRSSDETLRFWRLTGQLTIFGEIFCGLIAIFFALSPIRFRRMQSSFVWLMVAFHLLTFVLIDIREMAFVFVLAWIWSFGSGAYQFTNLNKGQWAKARLVVVATVMSLVLISSLSRFNQWTQPAILRSAASLSRLDAPWSFFAFRSPQAVTRLYDIEIDGVSVFTGARDYVHSGFEGNIYSRYPSHDVYTYLRKLSSSFNVIGLEKAQQERIFRRLMPAICPARFVAVLPRDESRKAAQIEFIRIRSGLDRGAPEIETTWRWKCQISSAN